MLYTALTQEGIEFPGFNLNFFPTPEYRSTMDFSVGNFVNRALKYLLEGLAVAIAAVYIPKRALPMEDIAALALVAAAVFALLDVLAPSVGVTARQGAGFGLGANLVGFPMRR
jgi:hypothetical protein